MEFNQDTALKTSSGEIKSHLLTFLSAKVEHHVDEVAAINDIAKDHRRILMFLGHLEAKNIRAGVTKNLYLKLIAGQQAVQQTSSDQFKVVLRVGKDTPYREEVRRLLMETLSRPDARHTSSASTPSGSSHWPRMAPAPPAPRPSPPCLRLSSGPPRR